MSIPRAMIKSVNWTWIQASQPLALEKMSVVPFISSKNVLYAAFSATSSSTTRSLFPKALRADAKAANSKTKTLASHCILSYF